MSYLPNAIVTTPSGPGVVKSATGSGCYVLMADGSQEWFGAETLTPRTLPAVTVTDAVQAERQRIAEWLEEEIKVLIAMGHQETYQRLKAVQARVLKGE